MIDKDQTKIFQQLFSQFSDINKEAVEKAAKLQWEFLANVMREGEHFGYRAKYLGYFGVKNTRPFMFSKRFLTKEEIPEFKKLNKEEQKLYLQQRYQQYVERYKEKFRTKPVIVTDSKGKEIRFDTVEEASKKFNVPCINIFFAIQKKVKTKKKLSWRLDAKEKTEERDNTTNINN